MKNTKETHNPIKENQNKMDDFIKSFEYKKAILELTGITGEMAYLIEVFIDYEEKLEGLKEQKQKLLNWANNFTDPFIKKVMIGHPTYRYWFRRAPKYINAIEVLIDKQPE